MDILKSVRTILGCFFVLSAAFLVSCGLDEPDEPDFFSQSIRYDYDRFPEPETEFFQVNSNGNLVSIPVGIPFGAGEDSTAVADAFFASVDSVYKATEEAFGFDYIQVIGLDSFRLGLTSDGRDTVISGPLAITGATQTILSPTNSNSIVLRGIPGDRFLIVEFIGCMYYYEEPDSGERTDTVLYRGLSNSQLNSIRGIAEFAYLEERTTYNLQTNDTVGIIYSSYEFRLQ